jgi:CDP-glucose 4,6-dehydratase
MEDMEMIKLFGGIYNNKRVLITGHTGFKGSWLALWLGKLGATVSGVALDPDTIPNHYELLDMSIKSYIQDIRNQHQIKIIFKEADPQIIFHLAAQPLVRRSYEDPIGTFETNVMGTAHVLEAAKELPNLEAVVVITSDKCYQNNEWLWGYRENDPMGGKDPYSSSKGCSELVTSAYRHSYFSQDSKVLVASARAGNVIGGGDWADYRILTDMVTAANKGKTVHLRFPEATRPWQYVLEPLSGYLTLGWKLLQGRREFAEAWNFGPNYENNISVLNLVQQSQNFWKKIVYEFDKGRHPHEAGFLMLDSSKAIKMLQWMPVWNIGQTVEYSIRWYREYYENNNIITTDILDNYVEDAQRKRLIWTQHE